MFTQQIFTQKKFHTKKFSQKFFFTESVRLSFVDLRWAQLYVSLVVFLFGISDQQQDLTQEPETGTWIHYSKMKTWRQKQTGQFEVFWIREVISEDDEVTIEYHEVSAQPQPLRPIPFKPPKKLQQLEPPYTQEELPMGILTDLSLTILSLRFVELW